MRPETTLDWIAFWFVIIGALAWGWFAWDVNILDVVLEKVWDPLDNIVFVLVAVAGLYTAVRALSATGANQEL